MPRFLICALKGPRRNPLAALSFLGPSIKRMADYLSRRVRVVVLDSPVNPPFSSHARQVAVFETLYCCEYVNIDSVEN